MQAVIFDSDGMLTDGARFSDRYVRERGIQADRMKPFFSGPFQKCLIGHADLVEELEKGWLTEWEWENSAQDLIDYWICTGDTVNQPVLETVDKLRKKGVECILATNQEKYRAAHLQAKLGPVFSRVFSSAQVGAKKPSADFFDAVFERLQIERPGIRKDDVLFWDDDQENVDGAEVYGFSARLFTDAPSYLREMSSLGLL